MKISYVPWTQEMKPWHLLKTFDNYEKYVENVKVFGIKLKMDIYSVLLTQKWSSGILLEPFPQCGKVAKLNFQTQITELSQGRGVVGFVP